MPRIIRALLVFFPVLVLTYIYAGWVLYEALLGILRINPNTLRFCLIWIAVCLNLYVVFLFVFKVVRAHRAYKGVLLGTWVTDALLAYPFWISLIFLAEITPFLLLLAFVKLPFYPLYEQFRETWVAVEHSIALVAFPFFACLVTVRVIIDTVSIGVTRLTLKVPDLPASLDGLRIVHISDVHVDKRTTNRKLLRFVKQVKELSPDLVFFTGDLVTSSQEHIFHAASLLGRITSRYGIYACLGDHDFDHQSSQHVTVSLNENGIKVLQNKNEVIQVEKENLLATFLTNTYSQRPSLDNLHFLMGKQPRGALDIVVAHQPSEAIVDLAADRGYHLFLAGHTHGGQVNLKTLGLTVSAAKIETPYYKGAYFIEQMLLSVNSGLGFSIVPVRYWAPAEVTLIKVKREEQR